MQQFNEYKKVKSLSEYVEEISSWGRKDILWYRGHGNSTFMLLYRDKKVDFLSDDGVNYNSMHMAESSRIQHYYAKNYPFIKDGGMNTTEWLGMAQHYGIKTRYFDWSTSAIHALIFALEQYFDDIEKAEGIVPCVWILKPQVLNKIAVKNLVDGIDENSIKACIADSKIDDKEIKEICKRVKSILSDNNKYVYMENDPKNKWGHLDYIYNLAYFDRLLKNVMYAPKKYLLEGNINPIFYFIAKKYIEGHSFGSDKTDSIPLAIIHPLNSERIRNQNGVFTVFPFPHKDSVGEESESLDYMRMEFNPHIKGTLCKICIMEPKRVYDELRILGVHKNWLYYEHEQVAKEIETGR